jgi:hypothetical protein
MYITVCYHQPANSAKRGAAGGAAARAGYKPPTSPCSSYYHQSISEAQTAQQEEGQGRWCATFIMCTIINSIDFNYQQELRESSRETQEVGGVLLCSSVLRRSVQSRKGGGGAVLPCTIINNYRSTRRTAAYQKGIPTIIRTD